MVGQSAGAHSQVHAMPIDARCLRHESSGRNDSRKGNDVRQQYWAPAPQPNSSRARAGAASAGWAALRGLPPPTWVARSSTVSTSMAASARISYTRCCAAAASACAAAAAASAADRRCATSPDVAASTTSSATTVVVAPLEEPLVADLRGRPRLGAGLGDDEACGVEQSGGNRVGEATVGTEARSSCPRKREAQSQMTTTPDCHRPHFASLHIKASACSSCTITEQAPPAKIKGCIACPQLAPQLRNLCLRRRQLPLALLSGATHVDLGSRGRSNKACQGSRDDQRRKVSEAQARAMQCAGQHPQAHSRLGQMSRRSGSACTAPTLGQAGHFDANRARSHQLQLQLAHVAARCLLDLGQLALGGSQGGAGLQCSRAPLWREGYRAGCRRMEARWQDARKPRLWDQARARSACCRK